MLFQEFSSEPYLKFSNAVAPVIIIITVAALNMPNRSVTTTRVPLN